MSEARLANEYLRIVYSALSFFIAMDYGDNRPKRLQERKQIKKNGGRVGYRNQEHSCGMSPLRSPSARVYFRARHSTAGFMYGLNLIRYTAVRICRSEDWKG